MHTTECGLQYAEGKLRDMGLAPIREGRSSLALQRPDNSKFLIAVRTSAKKISMKRYSDADLYIYLQNIRSENPTAYVLTRGEVSNLIVGASVAAASGQYLNKWDKVLTAVKG
jgi:hypothetical protein